MKTYYFKGVCNEFRETICDSTCLFFCHGDSRFESEIQAKSLRRALVLLKTFLGDCFYVINPRYAVINESGRACSRILRSI